MMQNNKNNIYIHIVTTLLPLKYSYNHILSITHETDNDNHIHRLLKSGGRFGEIEDRTTYIKKCGLSIAQRTEQSLGTPRNGMDYASSTHTTIDMFSYLDFCSNVPTYGLEHNYSL